MLKVPWNWKVLFNVIKSAPVSHYHIRLLRRLCIIHSHPENREFRLTMWILWYLYQSSFWLQATVTLVHLNAHGMIKWYWVAHNIPSGPEIMLGRLWSQERCPKSQPNAGTTQTPTVLSLGLGHPVHCWLLDTTKKTTTLLGEMADPGMGKGRYKVHLEQPRVQKARKYSKKNGDPSEEHKLAGGDSPWLMLG